MAYTEDPKKKLKNAEEYTVEFHQMRLLIFVCSTIWLVGLVLVVPVLAARIGAVWPAVFCAYAIPLWWSFPLMIYTKLVVSPEGVRFHQYNGKIEFIYWREMQRFVSHSRRGIQSWAIVTDRNKALTLYQIRVFPMVSPGCAGWTASRTWSISSPQKSARRFVTMHPGCSRTNRRGNPMESGRPPIQTQSRVAMMIEPTIAS